MIYMKRYHFWCSIGICIFQRSKLGAAAWKRVLHCNWCSIQCTQFKMHHTQEVPKIDKIDGLGKAMWTIYWQYCHCWHCWRCWQKLNYILTGCWQCVNNMLTMIDTALFGLQVRDVTLYRLSSFFGHYSRVSCCVSFSFLWRSGFCRTCPWSELKLGKLVNLVVVTRTLLIYVYVCIYV